MPKWSRDAPRPPAPPPGSYLYGNAAVANSSNARRALLTVDGLAVSARAAAVQCAVRSVSAPVPQRPPRRPHADTQADHRGEYRDTFSESGIFRERFRTVFFRWKYILAIYKSVNRFSGLDKLVL